MYPLILCVCGRSLGDLYDLYAEMRRDKYREFFAKSGIEIRPDYIPIAGDITVETGDILDALHLHLECCRTKMITQVLWEEVY